MKINEIVDYLENLFPQNLQEDYDNSGLIIGDLENEVSSVLICLDCVESVIDEAITSKCNLVISHHPLIFAGIKSINNTNYIGRSIIKAIKFNISIYAIHTNLDNAIDGVSSKIADLINLKNQKILFPKKNLLNKLDVYCPLDSMEMLRNSLYKIGAGSIGNYKNCSFYSIGQGEFVPMEGSKPYLGKNGNKQIVEEGKLEVIFPKNIINKVVKTLKKSHPYEEVSYQIYQMENKSNFFGSGVVGVLENEISAVDFFNFLKKKFNLEIIKHTKFLGNKVKKIAVCGGSGSFLLECAIKNNADVFITSDFKYHQFFNAEDKIIIADIGHYESEQYTKELLYDLLLKKFPTFAIRISEINTNPINYF